MNNKTATFIGYIWCVVAAFASYKGIHSYALAFVSLGQLWLIASFFIKD